MERSNGTSFVCQILSPDPYFYGTSHRLPCFPSHCRYAPRRLLLALAENMPWEEVAWEEK
jgi:hypothetical protein